MAFFEKPIDFSQVWQIIKQSLNSEKLDFTSLPIKKAVVLLAIPMILELSMESVFALVDIFFVNRWLGNHAATAVGLTESVITIVYSLAIGISMAATAVVARRTGEKDPEGAAIAAVQSLWLSMLVTLVISVVGFIYAADILRLMAAEEETIRMGTGYIRIMMGGSLVIMLLFLINGIFRGAGDASMAMKSLWIANLFNIIFCPLFIHLFGLDGAAIATTAGRGIGVCYQLYHLFKGDGHVQLKKRHLVWRADIMRNIVNIGAPGTIQFMIASGSWIVLARLVAETGHNDASAGYQTAIRVLLFFILPAWGLSNAATTLVGQHLGAGQPALAEQAVRTTAKFNAIFMSVVTVFFLLFSPMVIGWFTTDAAARVFGIQAIRIISLGYVVYGVGMVMANAFNGAGDTRTPTIINFFGFWMFQVPLAWLLAKYWGMGPTGVFIAIPVAEALIAATAFYIFTKGKWKLVKV